MFSSLPSGIFQILLHSNHNEFVFVALFPGVGGVDLSVTILLLAWYLLGWARVPMICSWRDSWELWRFWVAIPPQGSAVFSGFTLGSQNWLFIQPRQVHTGSGFLPWVPVQSWSLRLAPHRFSMPRVRRSLWLSSLSPLPSPTVSILGQPCRSRNPWCWPPSPSLANGWSQRFLSWEHCVFESFHSFSET